MSRSFKEDFKIGTESERSTHSILQNHFKTPLTRTPSHSRFDYEGATIYVELKTRTNAYRRYPTTMIPTGKCIAADTSNRQVFFVFKFTDGLYFIEYNKALFDTFERDDFQRPDRIDHVDKRQSYTYIPIQSLQPIFTEKSNTI
jgi:hypothetical protein